MSLDIILAAMVIGLNLAVSVALLRKFGCARGAVGALSAATLPPDLLEQERLLLWCLQMREVISR